MKLESGWWNGGIGVLKSLRSVLLSHKGKIAAGAGILLILAAVFFMYFRLSSKNRIFFHPLSENPKIKPAIAFFFQKDYLSLTSYLDSITPSVYGPDQGILLFYKAEAFFQQKKYQEAWHVFFSLSQTYPQFWQARFRLGCIHLLRHEMQDASLILETHQDLEEVNFWKARYWLLAGKKEEALKLFQKVSYAEAFDFSAEILKEKGKLSEALAVYQILAERFASYEPKKVLENLISLLEALEKPHELLVYLEKSEKLMPYDGTLKIKKGKTLYVLKKIKEAYEILSAPSLPKKDPEILKILAHSAFQLEKFSESIVYFEALPALSYEEQKMRAQALMKTYEFEKAAEILKNLLETQSIQSKDEVAHLARWLIDCQRELGELAEALKTAVILVSLEDSAQSYLILSQIQRQMNRPEDAMASLRKAAEKEPGMEKILIESLMEAGDLNQALELTEKMLKNNPYHEDGLFMKVKILFKQRRIEDAKIVLFTLAYLPPKNIQTEEQVSYLLGSLLFNEKRYQDAESFFDRTLKANPEHGEAALKKAFLLISAGKISEARRILIALKNQGSLSREAFSEGYYYLALIEHQERKYEKAREYASKVLESQPCHDGALKILKSLQ